MLRIISVSGKGMAEELPFENQKAYINFQKVLNGTEGYKLVRKPDK